MPRRGSRFYFIPTPFMVCFLLACSALGMVSSAIITQAATMASTEEVRVPAAQISLAKTGSNQAQIVASVAKTAAEKARQEKVSQEETARLTSAQTAATKDKTAPAAQPQGCAAAPPYIYIAATGMCMHIITVGLTAEGAIDTPSNTFQAGWFNGSAALGGGGTSFVDGHSPGVFTAIKGVRYGTVITIGLANGQEISYQVTGIENIPFEQVDMGRVLSSPGLNLMTCSGTPISNTYSHRFIVYSTRI